MTSQRVLRNAPGKQPPTVLDLESAAARVSPFGSRGPSPPRPGLGSGVWGRPRGPLAARARQSSLAGPSSGFWSQLAPCAERSGRVRASSQGPRALRQARSDAGRPFPRTQDPCLVRTQRLPGFWLKTGVPLGFRSLGGTSRHIPPAPTNAPSGTSGNSKRKIESGAAPRSPLPGARFPPPRSESVIPFFKLAEPEAVLGTRPV